MYCRQMQETIMHLLNTHASFSLRNYRWWVLFSIKLGNFLLGNPYKGAWR